MSKSNYHIAIRGKSQKKKKEEIPEVDNMHLTDMLKLNKPPPKPKQPKHSDVFESKMNHKLSTVVKEKPAEKARLKPYQKYG